MLRLNIEESWLALRTQPMSYPLWQCLANLHNQTLWPWHAHYAHSQALRCAQAQGLTHALPAPLHGWDC